MMSEEVLDTFIARYVKSGQIISIGTGTHSLTLLKKIAFAIEDEKLKNIQLIPTSQSIGIAASSFGIPVCALDEHQLDVAFEFASAADTYFNYLKSDSTSLIRDKMIAQSAKELIVMTDAARFHELSAGVVTVEISQFGYRRTLMQLQPFGEVNLRMRGKEIAKTESGHLMADILMSRIQSLDDLDISLKRIPGVIETGIFLGYADRLILHGEKIEVKSRLQAPIQANESMV